MKARFELFLLADGNRVERQHAARLPMPFAVVLVPRHSSLPSMAYTNSFRDPSSTQRMHKTPLLGPSSAMRRGQCPPRTPQTRTSPSQSRGGDYSSPRTISLARRASLARLDRSALSAYACCRVILPLSMAMRPGATASLGRHSACCGFGVAGQGGRDDFDVVPTQAISPTVDMLEKLARALDISLRDLFPVEPHHRRTK
jgi:hypothetical protein